MSRAEAGRMDRGPGGRVGSMTSGSMWGCEGQDKPVSVRVREGAGKSFLPERLHGLWKVLEMVDGP